MQTPKVDTSAAEAYEAVLVQGIVAPWAKVIVSDAQIKEGMTVLDVACGTGIATRYAVRQCGINGRAVGIDVDHGMLEVAKAVSMKEGLPTEYVYGSACELPFESKSFDVALCLQGLQYFPDQSKAMSELHRVLKKGSLMVVITWSEIQNCKGYWAMVSALEHRGIDAAAARKPFSLSNSVTMQSLAEEAGFNQFAVRTEQRLAHFPSTKAFVDAMLQGAPSSRHALEKVPTDDWENFLAEVDDGLKQWKYDFGIKFPMESNILMARA